MPDNLPSKCDYCKKKDVKTTVMIEGVGINIPFKSDVIEKKVRHLIEERYYNERKLYLEPRLCDKCIASKRVQKIFNEE